MTFSPPFSRTFSPTFDRRNTAGAWWNLFGAIPLANCVAAYQPKGAASLAASYVNLVTPGTYDAAPGVAPTWDSTNGWKFDGTQYLVTGVSVNGGGYSVVVRIAGVTWDGSVAKRIFGTSNTGNANPRMFIAAIAGGTNLTQYFNGSGISTTAGAPPTSGTYAIANRSAFLNGSNLGLTLTAWSGTNTNGLYIGAQNSGGTPLATVLFVGNIQAFVIYNNDQSSNMAALDTAINAI